MPKLSDMLPSKFLKKEDLPSPVLVTIARITHEIVDADTGEKKWAMHFHEFDKPLALNSTNLQIAAKVCGSDDSDNWINHKIVMYQDPNVSFAGKIVGGIRLRAPKQQAAPAPAPAAAPTPAQTMADMDDDVPF